MSDSKYLLSCEGENFMGLRRFKALLSPGVNLVKGPNGAGKSSFISLIMTALFGAVDRGLGWRAPSEPLFQGAADGGGTLTLSDGTELVVSVDAENKLAIKGRRKVGKRWATVTQKEIRGMISRLGVEPGTLLSMSPGDLAGAVRRILGDEYVERLDAMDAEIEAAVAARTSAKDRLEALGDPAPVEPVEPVDTAELDRQLAEAREFNRQQEDLQRSMLQATGRLKAAREALEKAEREVYEAEMSIAECPKAEEPMDLAPLQAARDRAGEVLAQAAAYKRYKEDMAKITAAEQARDAAEAKVKALREQRKAAAEAVEMPVPGLALENGKLRVENPDAPGMTLPLDQLNAAARVRLYLDIVAADNPDLRVIILRDTDPCTRETRREIVARALELGLQVLIESRGADDDAEGAAVIRVLGHETLEPDDPRWELAAGLDRGETAEEMF